MSRYAVRIHADMMSNGLSIVPLPFVCSLAWRLGAGIMEVLTPAPEANNINKEVSAYILYLVFYPCQPH